MTVRDVIHEQRGAYIRDRVLTETMPLCAIITIVCAAGFAAPCTL